MDVTVIALIQCAAVICACHCHKSVGDILKIKMGLYSVCKITSVVVNRNTDQNAENDANNNC
jgi:hypothetical protein